MPNLQGLIDSSPFRSKSHMWQLPIFSSSRALYVSLPAIVILAACSPDSHVTGPAGPRTSPTADRIAQVNCTGSVQRQTIACSTVTPLATPALFANRGTRQNVGTRRDIFGGQNTYVKLTSSNVSYDSGTEIFQFDVTVQNLLNEAMGTPDGTTVDTAGVKIFFAQGPTVTAGTGTITVANPDGVGTFSGSNQPYFKYAGILAKNQLSSAETWQLNVPATVDAFSFTLYVATTTQAMLVINEVLANPGGTITDANGEWFELYNAGTRDIDLQGYIFRDSSAAGIRPPNVINRSLVIHSGSYLVFGNTTNTTLNGGVAVDYAYGTGMSLANSLDAIAFQRLFNGDTLTIDYVEYASPGISAQNGISRELKNPALDNLNIDGSNWADASVTSVYGPGGRGTPGAQNSSYTP